MLSPCLFVVLLALGYFLIDKKTKTELISKCKKNKFMILGGIIFIYYFFLQNNVEGITVEDYHGKEGAQSDLTNFAMDFCWASNGTKGWGESLLGKTNGGQPIKGDGVACYLAMMRQANSGELLKMLDYDPNEEIPAERFTAKNIPGTDNAVGTGASDLGTIPLVQMPAAETVSITGMVGADPEGASSVDVEKLARIDDGTE